MQLHSPGRAMRIFSAGVVAVAVVLLWIYYQSALLCLAGDHWCSQVANVDGANFSPRVRPSLPMASSSMAPTRNECLISSFGTDGIGHQMEAKLTCIATAAALDGVAYVHYPLHAGHGVTKISMWVDVGSPCPAAAPRGCCRGSDWGRFGDYVGETG